MQRATITRETFGSTMGRLRNLFENIPSGEGIEGRLIGVNEKLKGIMGYNPNLTSYSDLKKVVVGQVTQIIGGETGSRLSDQDITRMLGAFPEEMGTTSERATKWKFFEETVDDIVKAYGGEPIFGNQQQGSNLSPEIDLRQQAIEELRRRGRI